jgi:hypothetical protein
VAATDRLPSRRRLVGGSLLALVLVVGAVLVGLAQRDDAAFGELPPTSRDDVSLSVDVTRAGEGVELAFTVEIDAGADEPLRLTDWSGGDRPAGLFSTESTSPDLLAAAHGDRRDGDPVVLHLGLGSIVGGGRVQHMEPPDAGERRVGPGEAVAGRATFDPTTAVVLPAHDAVRVADLERADGVRICLWEAGADRRADDPVVCADDDL